MNLDAQRIERAVSATFSDRPFSGVVHVRQDGETRFARGYAHAQRAERISNTIDTRFQVASGSKIFTAVAICQLVERGSLTFDTRLRDCLDVALPNHDPDITVHHLLTHTSGITSYFEEDVDDDYEALWQTLPMYRVRRPGDFLPLFGDKPMKFRPGKRFDYNDGGFILLGLIVEQRTDREFASYVSENVLAAAGMSDSGYFATDRLPERTAYAYIEANDGSWRTNFYAVPVVGAPDGGAYVTAPDMARFWDALHGHRLLGEAMTAQLLQSRVPVTDGDDATHYGYGIWLRQRAGTVTERYVTGWDPGVAFLSVVHPERNLLITLLGNTNGAVRGIHAAILEAMRT